MVRIDGGGRDASGVATGRGVVAAERGSGSGRGSGRGSGCGSASGVATGRGGVAAERGRGRGRGSGRGSGFLGAIARPEWMPEAADMTFWILDKFLIN